MSTERILVHRSIAEGFGTALKKAMGQVFGSDNPTFVLVSSAAVAKNKRLVDDAVSKGATTLLGSPETSEDRPTQMRPIIVSKVSKEMANRVCDNARDRRGGTRDCERLGLRPFGGRLLRRPKDSFESGEEV